MAARFRSTWAIATALVAAGCATTRHEPPPEVAPQPPEITAQDAAAEGQEAAAEAARENEQQAAQSTTVARPAQTASRGQRSRPTERSTQEIREQNAGATLPLDLEQRLDSAHDRLYTWQQGLVEATDRRFAAKDKPREPVPAAPFRIGSTAEVVDRSGGTDFAFDMNFDIALRLPNIEKRLRIFVTSDQLEGGTRDVRRNSQLRAGLRYQLLRDVDFDIGVRVGVPPVAFAEAKWLRQFGLGSWDFYPLFKVFIETKESLGSAAGATFDHWSGRNLVRSSSYAKWRADRAQTEWSHTLVYARARELIVPDRYGSFLSADDIGRGCGIRLLAAGDDINQVSRYEAGVFYRGRTPLRWLYWSAEPMVRWDRSWNWSADPGIRIGIDALFWDLAR
jgi:hypothetical protein